MQMRTGDLFSIWIAMWRSTKIQSYQDNRLTDSVLICSFYLTNPATASYIKGKILSLVL